MNIHDCDVLVNRIFNLLTNQQSFISSIPPVRQQFDHEKLDVYQLELQFVAWTSDLLADITPKQGVRIGEICDQLDRASLSALLNTAEGNGKRRRQQRAKFFDDSRGSVTECAACLDALVAKKIVRNSDIEEGKALLVRAYSILTKLVGIFDGSGLMRENEFEYHVGERGDLDGDQASRSKDENE